MVDLIKYKIGPLEYPPPRKIPLYRAKPTLLMKYTRERRPTDAGDALMATLYGSNLIGLEFRAHSLFLLHCNALENVLREQSDWLRKIPTHSLFLVRWDELENTLREQSDWLSWSQSCTGLLAQ